MIQLKMMEYSLISLECIVVYCFWTIYTLARLHQRKSGKITYVTSQGQLNDNLMKKKKVEVFESVYLQQEVTNRKSVKPPHAFNICLIGVHLTG